MDLRDLTRILIRPDIDVIHWLQIAGLLSSVMNCEYHDAPVPMQMKPFADRSDGYKWRCPRCKRRTSVRKASFFCEFPRLSLAKLLGMIFLWSTEVRQKTVARLLTVSERAVTQVFGKFRDICTAEITRRPIFPFGGPGTIIQIDESKFNRKPKYNRGRRPENDNWVFGIVTTSYQPSRGYFEVVRRRDAATLLPIIQRTLLPGSTVHSDDWAAYRNLQARVPNVAVHGVVVHRYHFVDPVTGVHTQNIESCWNRLKAKIKERRGVRREKLQPFLDEQMWRDWRGNNDVFAQFKLVLQTYYVV